MKLYAAPLIAVALLAGCGAEEQQPAPAKTSAVEAPPQVPVMGAEWHILAFGDSLFTGYGLQDGEGYPERLEAALRARGINARITNGGVSGDTTAAGRQRLAFTLNSQSRPPELVLISLGGNDMLRGTSPEQTRENLDAMLAELQERGIPAMLMGMLSPPNLGSEYGGKFDPIYPALAKKYDAKLVPFFLQPVLDRPHLVQQDRIHPTALGIDAMVKATVEEVAGALPKKDQALGPA